MEPDFGNPDLLHARDAERGVRPAVCACTNRSAVGAIIGLTVRRGYPGFKYNIAVRDRHECDHPDVIEQFDRFTRRSEHNRTVNCSSEPEQQRSYLPGGSDGSLAANLLGFVNFDGQGQYGVEGFYDQRLAGKQYPSTPPGAQADIARPAPG